MTENDDLKNGPGPEGEEEWVSRTQLKLEVKAITALGEQLGNLSPEQLAKIPMADELRGAIEETRRIKVRTSAMKRHMNYIGRLMRAEDVDAIKQAVDQFTSGTSLNTALFTKLERWRDRLCTGGNTELQAYLEAYPTADIQHLRQLVRNASKEVGKETPNPTPGRKLFKYLREVAEI